MRKKDLYYTITNSFTYSDALLWEFRSKYSQTEEIIRYIYDPQTTAIIPEKAQKAGDTHYVSPSQTTSSQRGFRRHHTSSITRHALRNLGTASPIT